MSTVMCNNIYEKLKKFLFSDKRHAQTQMENGVLQLYDSKTQIYRLI